MPHKIDYLSYTYHGDESTHDEDWRPDAAYFRNHLPPYINTDSESTLAPKRLGFDFGYAFDKHTYVWVNHKGLFLVEHTGAGCDHLQDRGILMDIIHAFSDRVTRIDIATDLYTATRPITFTDQRTNEKISASGHYISDTGETVYLGSKNSERFCRVYRYDGNHPRKDWLRLEYVYRRNDAKLIAHKLYTVSVADVAIASGERYGWQHHDWRSLRGNDSGSIEGVAS